MFSLPAFVHAAAITITEDNNASFLVNKYMYGTGWSYHTSTSPAHGTVTNSSVEVVTYKPNLNYCGSDQFKKIILCSFYSPPSRRTNSKMADHLVSTLHMLTAKYPGSGIILGADKNKW